jgi:hypothetical protein
MTSSEKQYRAGKLAGAELDPCDRQSPGARSLRRLAEAKDCRHRGG